MKYGGLKSVETTALLIVRVNVIDAFVIEVLFMYPVTYI
jgi:hypothetical protein